MSNPREGWAWKPIKRVRRHHYFRNGASLCRKHVFYPANPTQGIPPHPACKVCAERLRFEQS